MNKEDRGWPKYLLRGRVRTSTVALVVAFLVVWWLYQTYQPQPTTPVQAPATQVVPPGFVPDPSYTWVPRTSVRERPTTTEPTSTTTTTSTTATTTETTSPTSPTETTGPISPTSSPPGPTAATTSPTSVPPSPGPSPTPTPPAR